MSALVPGLTSRQAEIVRLAATGATDDEIGRVLNLSAQTVKSHMQRISAAWGTSGRVQIVVTAIAAGVLPMPGVAGRGSWLDVRLRQLRAVLDLPQSTAPADQQLAEVINAAQALRPAANSQGRAEAEHAHNPCCSSHGVPMSCAQYRRTHFVEVRPCCSADAARLAADEEVPRG
ncbi:response regulator transcription factor [Saccharothrix sp. HUAS TT1]|uniref:response regulator transcription factor n=1 Tax=unclassified Saccharothrix TaxID=2593673 RepID=UPI00345C1048